MKKIIQILLCAVLVSASAFSLDFGVLVTDNTDFYKVGENFALDQSEIITPSLKVPFNTKDPIYFITEASIKHKLNSDLKDNTTNKFVLDLPLLKFSATHRFTHRTSISAEIGRFAVSDSTGIVFNQPNDNVLVQFNSPYFVLSATAGYTGLLNSQNVEMINSSNAVYTSGEGLYTLAAPYFTVIGSVALPYFIFKQSISAEAIVAINTQNNDLTRSWFTGIISGPLHNSLFYNLSTTFEICEGRDLANFTQFNLSYFFDLLSSCVNFSASYASPDFTQFTKITASSAAVTDTYSELLKLGLTASIIPVSKLYLALTTDVLFKAPKDNISYYGFEALGTIQYQVFSDLQLSLKASTFLGSDASTNKTDIAFAFTIAF